MWGWLNVMISLLLRFVQSDGLCLYVVVSGPTSIALSVLRSCLFVVVSLIASRDGGGCLRLRFEAKRTVAISMC